MVYYTKCSCLFLLKKLYILSVPFETEPKVLGVGKGPEYLML